MLLTHTTHTLLGTATPGDYHHHHRAASNHLQIIPEDFSEHTSNAAEFSTHVPTAGELSSTVTIPQQARDVQDNHHMDMKVGVDVGVVCHALCVLCVFVFSGLFSHLVKMG